MDDVGISLNIDECKALFFRLKGMEGYLSTLERRLLRRIERKLYQSLSIQEAEALQNFSPLENISTHGGGHLS